MSTSSRRRLVAVAQREFDSVRRTRTFALLAAGFFAVAVGLAWVSAGGAGYVPLALDLLTPLELLVPVLALAFGYRALLGDRQRGELDVLRTYPVTPGTVVGGVFVGRATALLATLLVSLAAAPILVVLSGNAISVVAVHATADSWLLYLRFVVLTAAYAVVVLAVAVAVSSVARTTRQALALAVALFLAVAVGFDVSAVAALTGGALSPENVSALLAFSPSGAYRGLVLELVLRPATTRLTEPVASPLLNLGGLLLWTVGGLAVSVLTVWSE